MSRPEKWQIRKHIQIWPHSDYTQRVMLAENKSWAESYVKEANKRLRNLSKQPSRVSKDNPYREIYYVQQVKQDSHASKAQGT